MLRIRREAKMNQSEQISPFIEAPEELKKGKSSFGRWARGFFNFLFLLILGLVLLTLVIAFGYQIIHNPQVLGEWASGLVAAVEDFFQTLLAITK